MNKQLSKTSRGFKSRGLVGLAVSLTLLTVGCSDSDSQQMSQVDGDYFAVISGVASDFGSSEISIADASAPYDIVQGYGAQAASDISVATYGNEFYRIGRFQLDNITKYSFDNPGVAEWMFSTNDPAPSMPSNPYDMLFVSPTKAYVLRYGSSSIWIVDPSVTADDEAGFKTGEIDLRAYDADGIPQMSAAVIHDGKLFVVMQAMDASYAPGNAYLAVIDITTNTEIDIDADPLNGLALSVKNPVDIEIVGDAAFVIGAGRYARSWIPAAAEYTGGIEKISLDDYASELLVDDGDDTTHSYGNIDGLALLSETVGFFRGSEDYGVSRIYQFNPSTGVVDPTSVTGASAFDIQSIAVSPEGSLWVGIGDFDEPEIRVINPGDNVLIETIPTNTNPSKIVFTGDLSAN